MSDDGHDIDDETRPAIDALAGQVVGEYRLESLLGRGAMGVVYRARGSAESAEPGVRRAIKFLMPQLTSEPRFLIRFLREARTMAKMQHPGIVSAIEHGQWCDLAFLVMELVEGTPLDALLQRNKRLFEWRTMWLAVKLLDALAFLHSVGTIHRDLKPPNIIVDSGYGPRITDFGVITDLKRDFDLTHTGTIVGSSFYIPPELAGIDKNATIDGRADLYSLGCILFHCLAGHPPFTMRNPLQLLLAHKNQPPPRVGTFVECSPATERFIERLLAKRPTDRPESAVAAAFEARDILAKLPQPN